MPFQLAESDKNVDIFICLYQRGRGGALEFATERGRGFDHLNTELRGGVLIRDFDF